MYENDKEVSSHKEDEFKRIKFASQIAKGIKNLKGVSGFTFGIHGAWGEGKTSVMNFIKEELNHEEEIIIVDYNPWRFSNEESLLKSFYFKLLDEIGARLNSQPKKNFLRFWEKNKNKADGLFQKFQAVSEGTQIGAGAKSLGYFFIQRIERLKEEISIKLKSSGKKLVIFIDDIDRLDRDEIYQLLRLVKLNADISNSIFVLAFDKEMVAKAIGDRFGENNITAGRDYLEKIVQVSRELPRIQKSELSVFLLKNINLILEQNKINLPKTEEERYAEVFDLCIADKIRSPRQIKQYLNSLSFVIPLMKGEVNICDQMLLESVKTFYPNQYNMIIENLTMFSEDKKFKATMPISDIVALHEKLFARYESNDLDQENSRNLIFALFPQKKDYFQNNRAPSQKDFDSWYTDKRLCSSDYFDKYFTYSVNEDQFSDNDFELIYNDLIKDPIKPIVTANDIFHGNNSRSFLTKLENKVLQEVDLVNDKDYYLSKILDFLFINSTIIKDRKSHAFWDIDYDKKIAIRLAVKCVESFSSSNRSAMLTEQINASTDIKFCYSIIDILEHGLYVNIELEKKEILEIGLSILNRALLLHNDFLFKVYPIEMRGLIKFWQTQKPNDLKSYLDRYIKQNVDAALDYIKAFLPIINGEFYGDLSEYSFNNLVSFYNSELLYKILISVFSDIETNSEDVFWFEKSRKRQNDENIARQYFHWYSKIKA